MLGRVVKEIIKKWHQQVVAASDEKQFDVTPSVDVNETDQALRPWREQYNTSSMESKPLLVQKFAEWVNHHPSKKAWVQLGDWYLDASTQQPAEDAYRNALKIDPRSPAAHEGLGLVMLGRGQATQAIQHFEISDRFRPRHAATLNHWGLACLEQGNFIEAAKRFEKAIEADHNSYQAWHNAGLISVLQGQAATGIAHFQRSLAIKPDFGLAYSNLALALRDTEQLSQALQAAQQAIDLKSTNARVWVIGADVATDGGLFQLAQMRIERALALDQNHVGAHIAAGKLFTQLRDYTQARNHFEFALQIEPHNAEAQGGKGQLELLLGEWRSGWLNYEARRHTQPSGVRHFGLSAWQGTFSADQHLLVYAEQGLGDIVLFASCLPELIRDAKEVGAKITLETYPRLAKLFRRSFPDIEVIGHEAIATDLDRHHMQQCTHECPIGSLPLWYRHSDEEFPRHNGYLITDQSRVHYWQTVLRERFGSCLLVGITWKGGLLRSASVQRSMSLEALVSFLADKSIAFVILQHGEVNTELNALSASLRDRFWYQPDALADMYETAALTQALDAVVTVCNTQAHLTGALGCSGVVLVPSNPNWRYGVKGTKMLWYPSLELIRQQEPDNWETCLNQARFWLDNQCRHPMLNTSH